jgi:ADP-ribosylglycohydrolase
LDDTDLTMLSDGSLMTMFSKAVAWQNFADSIATEAEVREAELSSELDHAESVAVIGAWANAGTTVGPRGGVRSDFSATVAKAQRDTSPAVQSLRADHLRAKASRKRAQTVRDNSERIAQLLSRELSRRIGRDPVERRAGRFNS